jgi:Ca-activated chloride channel family protein
MPSCRFTSNRPALLALAVAAALAACSSPPREPQASAESPSEEREAPQQQPMTEAVSPPAPPVAASPQSSLDRLELSGSRIADADLQTRSRPAPAMIPHEVMMLQPPPAVNTENYAEIDSNPIQRVAEQPVSTFSIDVDTGSYANVRRILNSGRLPPQDAVRSEEFLNYFSYDYPVPVDTDVPFSVTTEVAPAPWAPNRHLLLVGLKGYEVPASDIPAANLVFLIDSSGSMQSADKLELLKQSFRLMVGALRPQDRVAIVTYSGSAGLVLPSTPASERATLLGALDRLSAGGSTNGGAGIELAYSVAQQNFIEGGVNRIILATDGDFNVGIHSQQALESLVEDKRRAGVALDTLGFGGGNYNDAMAEQLANLGNGKHAYIDTLNEGRKVLVESLSSTLLTIARDVKIQIEFNPAQVAEYRLIGYENRLLRREDFDNDRIDAGEIGAGHTVTALYEIALVGSGGERISPLRYSGTTAPAGGDELAFLRLRYKTDGDRSLLIEQPVSRSMISREASPRLRFAAAVAAFADSLRGGEHLGEWQLEDILALAKGADGADPFAQRGEFRELVALAQALSTSNRSASR